MGLIKTLSYFNYFCCRSAEEPRRSWRSATPTHDDLGGHQPPPTTILEVINPHPRRFWRSSPPHPRRYWDHDPHLATLVWSSNTSICASLKVQVLYVVMCTQVKSHHYNDTTFVCKWKAWNHPCCGQW